MNIKDFIDHPNIAEELSDDTLKTIGNTVVQHYDIDDQSRAEWKNMYQKAMKVAMQVIEYKSHPWPNSANVKFPLLTGAAIQFHAKAYPALVMPQIVQMLPVGEDPDGGKQERAMRLVRHMSYQIFEQMEDWEEHHDRLLLSLPITGCEFKKTYYDPIFKRNVSKHIMAKDLVINYWADSIYTAPRKTEIIYMHSNEIVEMQREGLFLDCKLTSNEQPAQDTALIAARNAAHGINPPTLGPGPRLILEYHGFYDLDEDGYEEPYIITVDHLSKKVLRIVARFDKRGIKTKQDVITKIVPVEYYTQFNFIPSPDGGIYGIGFGHLIAPLNYSVNTIISQLIDAGTLANLPGGFISRQLRMAKGTIATSPGNWITVNAAGQDLARGLFPLPYKEPSSVLFQLMVFLINAGERIASTTDLQMGESPGQNQKAATSQIVQENGLRVFTAIYKRVRAAMKREFQKIFYLNSLYLSNDEYVTILNPKMGNVMESVKIVKTDYRIEDFDVTPAADPNLATLEQKLQKAKTLVELMSIGPDFDRYEIERRILEAVEVPNPEAVLPPKEQIEQPPNLELMQLQLEEKKLQLQEQDMVLTHQREMAKLELEATKAGTELDLKSKAAETAELKAHGDVINNAQRNSIEQQRMVNEKFNTSE
jgi:chaperonin GroES